MSSEQQALGSSLKDQQEAIAAGAKSVAGLKVATENMHVEAASSLREKIEKRVEIHKLMEKVCDGDLIVVDKVDRWSRDPEFTYTSIRQIREKGGNVYFVGEGIDASTRDGDSQLNFRILFAREEAKRIKERMVGTRRRLRDRGYFVEGRPPFGYRLPAEGEEKYRLIVVDEEAALVRKIFKLAIGGKGFSAISEAVGLPQQRVAVILKRARIYLGEVESAGQIDPKTGKTVERRWIKGRHEAIIDQATYERSRFAMLSRRTRATPGVVAGSRTESWILRDVARCAHCGGRMSSRYSGRGTPGRDGKPYRVDYYVCYRSSPQYRAHAASRLLALRSPTTWTQRPMAAPCDHRGAVRVHDVEAMVEPLIKDRLVELREAMLAMTKGKPLKADDDEATEIQARLVRLAAKRERLVDALGDGTLNKGDYERAIAKVDDEEVRLHERARQLARPRVTATKESRATFLKSVDKLLETWERTKARPALRREIVRRLTKSVAMAKGEDPVVSWFTIEEMSL